MKRPNSLTMITAAVVFLGVSGALLATQMSDRVESSAVPAAR